MCVPAVERRIEQIRADGERIIKEVEHLYDMEILRLPPEIREMNWVEFFGTGLAGARFPVGNKTSGNKAAVGICSVWNPPGRRSAGCWGELLSLSGAAHSLPRKLVWAGFLHPSGDALKCVYISKTA